MTSFKTTNPATGSELETYSYRNDKEIRGNLAKSETAFGHWKNTSIKARLAVLAKVLPVLEEKKNELAMLATREMGKPILQALAELEKCELAVSYYREHAEQFLSDTPIPTENLRSYITFQPLGPVLCIMPWNFPYWQVFRFAVPAMVAGNPVILKHAENTTGVGLKIQAIFKEAGLPDGVFQTVLADHDQTAAIIRSQQIRAVSLTGSERAGRAVAATAGSSLKKCVLELGGSDPYLILPDADIRQAAMISMRSRLFNSGQTCIAAKRFIVHQSIYDSFREECIDIAEREIIGDPTVSSTTIGPIARKSVLDETKLQIERSVAAGASIAFSSKNTPKGGQFLNIVILENVMPGQPVFDDEVFAPVVALVKYDCIDEAIHLANQHRYGLGAAIFTADFEKGEEIARTRLDAGFAAVNSMVASDPRLPFGGIKNSGYGRELAKEGLLEFVNTKTVIVNR